MNIEKAAAILGRKGGLATGPKKRRGSSAWYSKIAKLRKPKINPRYA